MSKIKFLAVQTKIGSSTVLTKTALRELIKSDPDKVRFVPVMAKTMTPDVLALYTAASKLPAGVPVSVIAPVGRNWTAEVEKKKDGKIVVR